MLYPLADSPLASPIRNIQWAACEYCCGSSFVPASTFANHLDPNMTLRVSTKFFVLSRESSGIETPPNSQTNEDHDFERPL